MISIVIPPPEKGYGWLPTLELDGQRIYTGEYRETAEEAFHAAFAQWEAMQPSPQMTPIFDEMEASA